MRATPLLACGAALALALVFQGCSCGGNSNPNPDGGTLPDGGQKDGGQKDGGLKDGGTLPDGGQCSGDGVTCADNSTCCTGFCDLGTHTCAAVDGGPTACGIVGAGCNDGSTCCSGLCDPTGHTCVQPAYCNEPGVGCKDGTQCCSGTCTGGVCSSTQCKDVGTSCGSASECCTGICNGTCQYPAGGGACNVTGEACGSGADCCSTDCQGGHCEAAYVCQANDDLCGYNASCCSGSCTVNDGGSGVCNSVGGYTQSGNPCNADNGCTCNAKCPAGICYNNPDGVAICAFPSGCNMSGDPCTNSFECCGSVSNGVVCKSGACGQGTACIGAGDICGKDVPLPDGGTVSVSAPDNCCWPVAPPSGTNPTACRLDSSGVPRCFGECLQADGGICRNSDGGVSCLLADGGITGYTGDPGCCIDTGNRCDFSDECCNGAKCLSEDGGAPVCTVQTCLGLGADCTLPDGGQGSGCCAGSVCGATSEIGYACQLPSTNPDGGTVDGGTDAGTACFANGATCANSGDCCSGICADAGSGLQCQTPSSCQPQSTTCTTSSDCCSGLSCASDSTGALTCQPSVCPQAGQTCSPSTPCCSGLACVDSAFVTCNGTTACSCQVLIN